MDRCRCPDYEAAVAKLKFFTVGTYRPDIIENFNRGEYKTTWVTNSVSHEDLRFLKPKAYKKVQLDNETDDETKKRILKVEKMWCPYMSPVKRQQIT